MKNQISSAQVVLPCVNLNRMLEFFTTQLGFRVQMISPADAPLIAVITGYGLTLRLETALASQPLTLRLEGDFSSLSDKSLSEISAPENIRIIFADEESALEIPVGTQEFVVSEFDNQNSWAEGRAGMLYRDLIPGRLGEKFVASHISIPRGGIIPDYVHYHKIRFQMIYCLAGWARLVYEDQGAPFIMKAGDCILQPPEIRHRVLESSAKFEVLEIGCPAIHETFADYQLNLPNESVSPARIFGANQRFTHHVAAQAAWRDWQIEGIQSRETGISQASEGLADVRLLRALTETSFSVAHQGELLFFFIVTGNLRLAGEDFHYRLKANDCFVLPSGAEYLITAEKGMEMLRVMLPPEEFS